MVANPITSEIFIPVLGVTGVGKSTFINIAAGKVVVPVNDGVTSNVDPIKTVIVTHPRDSTRRITFVDTPGFDDTFKSHEEILDRILRWLESPCNEGIKLAGVVYLHDIGRPRLVKTYGTLAKRLAAHNTVLATTMWHDPEKDAEQKREAELSESFWKGSNMPRFLLTHKSAWDIIDLILQKPPLETPQFRQALLGCNKPSRMPPDVPNSALARFLRRLFVS